MHRCIALMMRRARHLPATAPQSCCKTCHRSLPRAVPPGGRGSVRRHPTAQPREPRGLRHLAVPKVCSGQGRSGDRAGHVQAPAAPMQPQLVPRCRRCSHAEPFRRCVSLAQPAGWLAGRPLSPFLGRGSAARPLGLSPTRAAAVVMCARQTPRTKCFSARAPSQCLAATAPAASKAFRNTTRIIPRPLIT
jgi:hypothetical protein